MNTYSFLSAGRIVGGADSIEQIAAIAADFGAKSALIISDQGVAVLHLALHLAAQALRAQRAGRIERRHDGGQNPLDGLLHYLPP